MKYYVLSTEIYQPRLHKFLRDNPKLSDLNIKVKMGINSRAIEGDVFSHPALREYVDFPCTWPLGSVCGGVAVLEIMKEVALGSEPVTLFEDDAILSGDFVENIEELLSEVDADWDLVQWGFNWNGFAWIRIGHDKSGPIQKLDLRGQEGLLDIFRFRSQKVKTKLYPLETAFGPHAVSISIRGIEKVLSNFKGFSDREVYNEAIRLRYKPVGFDCMLTEMHPFLKSYLAFPPLSFTFNDKSKSAIWNPEWTPESLI